MVARPYDGDETDALLTALRSQAQSLRPEWVRFPLDRAEIRVRWKPPRKFGRVDLEGVQAMDLTFEWAIFTTDWLEEDPEYVDREHRGWRSILEPAVREILQGLTVESWLARGLADAEDVFKRIARNEQGYTSTWSEKGKRWLK